MENPFKTILSASKRTLKSPKDWLVFLAISMGVFWLFVMVPVWTTPGNDFFFQLSIAGPAVAILMAVLALLNGLLIMMHVYIRKQRKGMEKLGIKGTASGAGSIMGSLAATIGCASCYSSVLSIFGVGGVAFLVEYRWLVASIALGIVLLALAYTGNRIEKGCKVCSI